MYREWNRWSDEGFTFLVPDVSISWGYLLVQMSLWQLMYLQDLDIRYCRCSFLDRCICKTLIFSVADALYLDQCICNLLFFELADTFKPACHVQLHLHLAFSITWGYSPQKFCILNPLFLNLADTSRRNFASSTCPFCTLQIHPTEFLHPHFQKIHYHKYLPYSLNSMTWADTLLTKKLI